jgi:6-phosphogluconate dehydrogenase
MLPSGQITARAIDELSGLVSSGDIIVDGGNSHFKDDIERSKVLGERGIEFVDCGTSGGIWGAERGYCLMIGGRKETVDYLDPIFRTLAPGNDEIPKTPDRADSRSTAELGYLHCGSSGAGHFAKMVHNGIEYGLMQAFAEGFDLLYQGPKFGYKFPLHDLAETWRHGSVITSWLLDLIAIALADSPDLAAFKGYVEDSGEGRWAIETALEAAVPCSVLSDSLYVRFRSRVDHTFAEKVLSAMRRGFGGHVESLGTVREGRPVDGDGEYS